LVGYESHPGLKAEIANIGGFETNKKWFGYERI
jgi:hypothetical protein